MARKNGLDLEYRVFIKEEISLTFQNLSALKCSKNTSAPSKANALKTSSKNAIKAKAGKHLPVYVF